MGILSRLILAIILVVGGSLTSGTVSARASLPCHEMPVTHDHGDASGPCHPASTPSDHCLTPAGTCCVVVLPAATDAVFVRLATIVTWTRPGNDAFFGRPAEPATPPPRA